MIEATYVHHCGSDLTTVNAARVSFGKESEMDMSDPWGPPKLKERDAKLIKYLAKHKHLSPFGHAFSSFHVKAPLFVARQLVKHSYLRWNEISRRYVNDEPEFYTPDTWRAAAENVKQGSGGDCQSQYFPSVYAEEISSQALENYNKMLMQGVCAEQARMILPQNMMTEWYWSGSLDAFSRMCRLRCAKDTQVETQHVAWAIHYKMAELFPVSWEALTEVSE